MSAALTIGTRRSDGGSAVLDARRLNRHTFWCGQSGSGKTYALGVFLEQVLLHTELPIVVLDPNSDFVRLDAVREDADEEQAARLRSRDIRVLRSVGDPADSLVVRFFDLPVRSRAAVLQIDPVVEAEDFNAMLRLEQHIRAGLDAPLVPWLRAREDPIALRIAMRLENLGISDWNIWAWGQRDVNDVIDERPDATVVDLGGFSTANEPKAAALAILDHLWERRADRIARLIVIDEAHNLCQPDPASELDRLLTERIVQIAAEGRKYGLWLVLSTQRPGKLHPNALSQCDNLTLMKMSSRRDLEELASVFGYVPEELLSEASEFTQGQALFAGGFAGEPLPAQMGSRLTPEGGTDVPVPMREETA